MSLLKEHNLDFSIVEYLKTPLTPSEIISLSKKLGKSPGEFVRKNETDFKNNNLEKQLNEANIRIHKLHDIIEEMKQLSQSSIDNLIKSLDISNKRWNTIEDHYGWNKYKE